MKKNLKTTLIFAAIVAVIGIFILLLKLPIDDESPVHSSSSQEQTAPLLAKNDEDIAAISFSSEFGEYVIIPKAMSDYSDSEITASTVSGQDSVLFTISGLEGKSVDSSVLTAAAKSLYRLPVVKVLGPQDNLAEFGLEGEGVGKAVLKYTDGSLDTIVIGTESGSGSGRYLLYSDKVYIVSDISDSLFAAGKDFFSKDVYTVSDNTATDADGNSISDTDILESLNISGVNFPQGISLEYNQGEYYSYRLTSPVKGDLNSDKMANIIAALKTLKASSVELLDYSGEDLASYGLDQPFATADYTMNSETHILNISAEDSEGYCYLTADSIPNIYRFSWSSVSPWSELEVMDIRSPYLLLPNINQVSGIVLSQKDTETVFAISREEDPELSTQESISYILSPAVNGKVISVDEVYQPFYQDLASLSLLSVEKPDYDSQAPALKLSYKYFDGKGDDILCFFPIAESDRYAVELNSEFTGIMRKSSIDNLLNKLEAVLAA